MKENKLVIKIDKPAIEAFEFTLNPENTPLWIDSIVKEEVNEQPPQVGTVYRNVNRNGEWSEYVVTALEENKMFEWASKDGKYHVRYTFNPIDNNTTELEYYEWVDNGELKETFTQNILEKLKSVLENEI